MEVMKNRIAVGALGLMGAAAVALWSSAGGPQERKQQEQPLRHDAAAVVKLVPVRVVGKDGRPVTGLRKEDFVLLEDGQRKTITEFEVHALTEAGMMVTPALPAGTESAARRSGAMNRKFFFFLDQQGSDQAGKAKARTVALRFLDTQVRPGDQVAVLGFYSMSGFYIHEYLTADMERVRRAINKPNEVPPSHGDVLIVGDDTVDAGVRSEGINVWTAGGETMAVAVEGGEASEASPAGVTRVFVPGSGGFGRTDFAPRMLDLVEVFKTIPGNKTLVLFTARDMGSEAERLGKLFGAAGTTVFAVNTQDWKMSPMGGAKIHFIWWDHSLKNLSAASGGKYFADINDTAGFANDVQDLSGHYYVLGYYVRENWEGKYHTIKVEVAVPEARVLAQDGYYDPKPFAKMSDFEKDIHLLDLTWSDQPAGSPLPMAVDPLVIEVAKTFHACLLTKWDVGSKMGVRAARVEVFALLRDESGTPLVSRKWDADLAPYAGRALFPYLSAVVPAGTSELRLVVRDRETGEASVGRVRFDSAAGPEEGVVLGSPVLFEAGAEAAFMRLPTKQDKASRGKPGAEETSLTGLYRLIPKGAHPVIGEVPPGPRKLIVVLPFEIRPREPDAEPILGIEAKLIARPDGSETPLEIKVREHRKYEGRPDILLADITLPALVAGAYDLEVSLEDVGTERRAAVRKPLSVR
jgi:VWFA-related protein